MKKNKPVIINNSKELATALGLSTADHDYMVYKAELSEIAIKAIEKSKISVTELVQRSGLSRSKVSALKNGAIAGISIDLMIRVIAATGTRLKLKAG